MKRQSGRFGMFGIGIGIGVALIGCGQSQDGGGTLLGDEEVTLVAALAANDDGSDEAWTSGSGGEPFLVEGCGFGTIAARVIERFDSDGSGDLSEEERDALVDELGDPGDRFDLLVSIYDTDGSSALEASELEVVKADIAARCESRLEVLIERFDADGDGVLDADERDVARAALRERFAGRGPFGAGGFGPPGRRGFGGLVRERLADRRAALIDEFDADQNGELDAAEREALADHLRACVRGEELLLPETPADEPGTDSE